jgi:hypothetical protein
MPRREIFLSSLRSRSVSASGDRFRKDANFETKRLLKIKPASATRATRRASGKRSDVKIANHQGKTRMNETFRTRPREERSPSDPIPYTKEALERDLKRVREAGEDCQTDRRRDAIYGYLKSVYDLVSWWSAEGCEVDRARRASGAPPTPRERTNGPEANGAGCCGTQNWGRTKEKRSPRSSSAKAASTNATLGTIDASGDLPVTGDQSRRGGAAQQTSERRWFAGYGLDLKSVTGAGASLVSGGIARSGR